MADGDGGSSAKKRWGWGFVRYFVPCLLGAGGVAIATVILWSPMGIGEDVLGKFMQLSKLSYACGAVFLGLGFILYLLDFFWPHHIPGKYCTLWEGGGAVGHLIVACLAAVAFVACICKANTYPWAPLVLTTYLCPVVLAIVRKLLGPGPEKPGEVKVTSPEEIKKIDFDQRMRTLKAMIDAEVDVSNFYRGATYALVLVATGILIAWIVWACVTPSYLSKAACDEGDYDRCRQEIFILWVAPLILSVNFYLIAGLTSMRLALGQMYHSTDQVRNQLILDLRAKTTEHTEEERKVLLQCRLTASQPGVRSSPKVDEAAEDFKKLTPDAQERYLNLHVGYLQQLQLIVKCLLTMVLFLAGGIYVLYMLLTADKEIIMMIQAMLALLLITFACFIYGSFRRLFVTMGMQLADMPLVKSVLAVRHNDWFRAGVIFVFGPLMPALALVCCLNQCVRKCRGLYKKGIPREPTKTTQADSNEAGPTVARADSGMNSDIKVSSGPPESRLLTQRVCTFMEQAESWDWQGLVLKTYIIGGCAVGYVITPIMLNVFLAGMIHILKPLNIGLIIFAAWLLGFGLFMLPPVPGPPVYLFSGLLLATKGAEVWKDAETGSTKGFWYGTIISIAVCWFLKMSSAAAQQVCIGRTLGNRMMVRQAVQVHKPFVRAIGLLLRQRGTTFGKVVIVSGGPDWPCAVLAGILGIPVLPVLKALVPITPIVTLTSLVGSFYLKRAEAQGWKNAGDMCLIGVAILSAGYLACIAWVIQDTYVKEDAAITRPMLEYVDLEWLDHREEEIAKKLEGKCLWSHMPKPIQVLYVLGCVGMIAVGQIFYWEPHSCFGAFEITGDIKALSAYGKSGSLIKKLGLAGLLMAAGSMLGVAIQLAWKTHLMRKPTAEAAKEVDKLAEDWKAQRRKQAEEAQQALALAQGVTGSTSGSGEAQAAPATAQHQEPAAMPGVVIGKLIDGGEASRPSAHRASE